MPPSLRVVRAGEMVNVVGRLGEPGTEAVDEALQAFEQGLVAGIEGRKPLARGFGSFCEGGEVDTDGSAVLHQHLSPNHDGMHGTAVFAVDQLVGRVVAGYPVDEGKVVEEEVGLVDLGGPAGFDGKRQGAGA